MRSYAPERMIASFGTPLTVIPAAATRASARCARRASEPSARPLAHPPSDGGWVDFDVFILALVAPFVWLEAPKKDWTSAAIAASVSLYRSGAFASYLGPAPLAMPPQWGFGGDGV